MIFVNKPLIDKEEWRAIVKQGEDLSIQHLREFNDNKKIEINDTLYKKFMQYLLDLFGGKCAYCETRVKSNQPGDVEHFRPKGRVLGDDFKPVRTLHPTRAQSAIQAISGSHMHGQTYCHLASTAIAIANMVLTIHKAPERQTDFPSMATTFAYQS